MASWKSHGSHKIMHKHKLFLSKLTK